MLGPVGTGDEAIVSANHDIDLISLRFGRDLGKLPPIGLLYLAASLDAAGYRYALHDCQMDPGINAFDVDALAKRILETDAPILGLSAFNDAIPLVIATLDRIADDIRHRRVFLGGPGVVGIAGPLLERLPQVEAVVVGEGETALPLLLANRIAPGSMPGVWSRNSDGVVCGNGKTPRENLNRFGKLPWDWCQGRGYSRVPLSTMRGCPFDCQFCEIIAFMGRKVSTRELDRSMADLDCAMAAIGSNQVDVLDDTFTLSKKRVHQFCQLLTESRRRVEFSIYSRIDTIDRPMMEALARAGCRRVFFGIDAGDAEVLERIHKEIDIEEAESVIAQAAEYFDVTASMIWGYPFESGRAFDATLGFANRCLEIAAPYRVQPQLHLLSPSAGTPLFDTYGDQMILEEDVEGLMCGTLGLNSFRADYGTIFGVIRQNPLLAAPFYRYTTPDFAAKSRRVEAFNRHLDIRIGERVEALLMED